MNPTLTQTRPAQTTLVLADPLAVKHEIMLVEPKAIAVQAEDDSGLDSQASEFVRSVLAFDPSNPAETFQRESRIQAVEALGAGTQKEASHRSAMLREPIRKLAARGEDGGVVASSLMDLKMQVEELDPGKLDLKAGWFTRTLGLLPGVGTPLKRYFTRFESSQTVIDAVIRSLEEGKNVLQRDNITLAQDQKVMRQLTFRLENTIRLGMLIDEKLSYALEREIGEEDPRRRFIGDELLFPLRQRIQDLQQQLAVNQQGILAIELIIRNNKELMKGVDRGIHVTVNALNVAVTVALALANQKIVMDKINAVNQATNRLIAQTAAQLRTQGAEVQNQASQTMLDMDVLKQAFVDIEGALEDISRFRQKALPMMAENILEMDRLTETTRSTIQRLEQGNQAAPAILLDVTQ